MSAIPCFISLWLAAGKSCTRTFVRGGCREHERLSERVIVDVPRRHDANHPPGWAARNKDSARPTRKAPPRRSRAFVFAISYAGFGGPSQVRAVASTLSHRRLFRFLFRCAAPPFLPPARKKSVFPTILRRRKLSVTNVTRLDFIFVMSDIQNANTSPFSAGLPNWHSAGTATCSRGSATQMLERPNMKPCRSTLNGAPRARVLRYR